ncbi:MULTISPECIES: hypothetical protein [unclassified Roseobacter]|uniref:Excinuclease ABC subunit B n=1 Tax=Roseobacter sinensis TaxID=2931391 RepID=A0ABT3BJD7_9RHOB|nr:MULTISPECIES: hypothetical protein [unclassified Roseobacter]MCV3273239.1 hypothetical protein [Roseobacter sp. WL0113]GIT88724.1 hypothetical protein ROBYS_37400 [Roseobacter sp. OBYS 0001]
MKICNLLLFAAISLSSATAFAQGLVPAMDSEYEFCQKRPPEPEWVQNLHVRESYKRLLIQSIYRLEGYQRVAAFGDCRCDTLFPPWSSAVQQYNDNFLHLEQFEAMQTRRAFQDQGSAVRRSVQKLCEAEGNW